MCTMLYDPGTASKSQEEMIVPQEVMMKVTMYDFLAGRNQSFASKPVQISRLLPRTTSSHSLSRSEYSKSRCWDGFIDEG